MKNVFFLAAIACLVISTISCKSKQAATNSTNTKTEDVTSNKFRLVVSFISKGEGPDRAKTAAFVKYMEGHPKKPVYIIETWGREGESDYCFNLKELSKSEQTDFIANVTKMMAGSDMVFVKENAESNRRRN